MQLSELGGALLQAMASRQPRMPSVQPQGPSSQGSLMDLKNAFGGGVSGPMPSPSGPLTMSPGMLETHPELQGVSSPMEMQRRLNPQLAQPNESSLAELINLLASLGDQIGLGGE